MTRPLTVMAEAPPNGTFVTWAAGVGLRGRVMVMSCACNSLGVMEMNSKLGMLLVWMTTLSSVQVTVSSGAG